MRTLCTLLLCTLLLLSSASGAEAPDEWMAFYYKKPSPEMVVTKVREFASMGYLKDANMHPLMIGFLSTLMAQNPTQVGTWFKEFEDLEKEPREVILTAAWYSDTEAARAYFKVAGRDDFLKERAPKILEQEINSESSLDMVWGSFMATGDLKPIRRVVSAFELAKYASYPELLKHHRNSEEHRKVVALGEVFRSSANSLDKICRQHPLVLEHCEKIFAEGNLPEYQDRWLKAVLVRVKPDKYSYQVLK